MYAEFVHDTPEISEGLGTQSNSQNPFCHFDRFSHINPRRHGCWAKVSRGEVTAVGATS